jgi:hypothetical protein
MRRQLGRQEAAFGRQPPPLPGHALSLDVELTASFGGRATRPPHPGDGGREQEDENAERDDRDVQGHPWPPL